MPLVTEVLFAGQLSDDEAAELAEAFEAAGLAAQLREVSTRRSLGDIAWLVLAALPLKPFFDQLATDVATDAYRRLKTMVGKVYRCSSSHERPDAPQKVLLLQDNTTGAQIVLEPDLPDEAYEQLLRVDLAAIRRGPLHYDRHLRRWRSELDEATTPPSPVRG